MTILINRVVNSKTLVLLFLFFVYALCGTSAKTFEQELLESFGFNGTKFAYLADLYPLMEKQFYLRNYTWPREEYVPNTKGWNKLMHRRFAQISEIEDKKLRALGLGFALTSAVVAPNFTESGWALLRAPDQSLVNDLKKAVKEGLLAGETKPELKARVVQGTSLMIERQDLMDRVLRELQPVHENWVGFKLKPQNSYGFRLYKNGSSLKMHVDKPNTHIISSILHIDHSEDSKPWPLIIEDFQGNTNEVYLESGDMLFYESSKCLHGRPIPFEAGEDGYYTSVFTHYSPAEEWVPDKRYEEVLFAFPPGWDADPAANDHEVLRKWQEENGNIGSRLESNYGFEEPECDFNWCALKNTRKVALSTLDGDEL